MWVYLPYPPNSSNALLVYPTKPQDVVGQDRSLKLHKFKMSQPKTHHVEYMCSDCRNWWGKLHVTPHRILTCGKYCPLKL